jgi:pantoate--beta-alanine ligase
MKVVTNYKELQEALKSYPEGKHRIALVPTMGALHEGHLSLVRKAQELADIVWVSIFVNPLQFGPNEDYSKYPRTLEADIALLESSGVNYLFAPNVELIYPEREKSPAERTGIIQAKSSLANKLCGLSRPGHFDGVCTVVKRLFDLIKPDLAIFGKKDYQQLKIIQDMVQELKLGVEIIPASIVREKNGLAMSSRNQYLNESQKTLAANIYKELNFCKEQICSLSDLKKTDIEGVFCQSKKRLESLGIQVEYLEIHWDRIFVAARVGKLRLIDNLDFSSP